MRDYLLYVDWYPALSILRAWICDVLFLWGYFLWSVFYSFGGCLTQKVKGEYSDNFNSLKK